MMSAAEAAAALGVTRATLYAYVSRGLLHSQAGTARSRARLYAREDVDRLRRRAEARRDPSRAAAGALDWGVPVLESAITAIDGRALYYRGHDVATLARDHQVADVASLLWTGAFGAAIGDAARPRRSRRAGAAPAWPAGAPFISRAQITLASAAAVDETASDLRPSNVIRVGWDIVSLLTDAAIGTGRPPANPATDTIDRRLARAWRVDDRAAEILRMTLVLCADHELNVSSFTARCVASSGATPYAAVIAGLSAIEGFRHGGASARVEAMLASIAAASGATRGRVVSGAIRRELAARLRRGEDLASFGHPLYPSGDPRAILLLDRLRQEYSKSPELAFVSAVIAAADRLDRDPPNVDFALAAVARVLALPAGAPMVLFAIGRSLGWIAHVMEQYASGQLVRPRARYVGPQPLGST
jgi:citrate synthase